MVFPEHEMREQIGSVLNIDDGNETMNSMVRVSHFLFNYSEDSVVSLTLPIMFTIVTFTYPPLAIISLECYARTQVPVM